VRALLFDLEGNLIAKGRQETEPYFSAQPGWVEQRPQHYWWALGQACERLWASTSIPRQAVRGIAVTSQRGTVINLDACGRVLRPAIVWMDQRRAELVEPLPHPWKLMIKLLGLEATVDAFRAQAQANWIAQQQPEIWQRTEKFLLLSGYLNWRLTGNFVDSVGSQVSYLPFDFRRQRWARHGDFKWRLLPIRRRMLPELVPPGTVIGSLNL
jgi:sugar (pentulose or hexulose) kinase